MASIRSASVLPFCLARSRWKDELVGVAHGGEGGHRDQASFLRVQLVAEPDLAEENVVGEADQGGR